MVVAVSPCDYEYYTPKWIINAVEWVFPIDLDPCSDPLSLSLVPAKTKYTEQEDGLKMDWFGNVYLNPPYGRVVSKWIDKLVSEYKAGRVSNAICLLPVKSDTKWFNILTKNCVCWCSIDGRVSFMDSSGNMSRSAGTFASGLFLLSKSEDIRKKFIRSAGRYGKIWAEVVINDR